MLIYITAGYKFFHEPLKFFDPQFTNNLDEYLTSTDPEKIAITCDRFGQQHTIDNYQDYLKFLKNISSASDLVFIIENELHRDNALLATLTPDNVYWSVPGIINSDVKQICNASFFMRLQHLYRKLDTVPEYANSYVFPKRIYTPKQKIFDALLGETKFHRDFIYYNLLLYKLQDDTILSYRPETKQGEFCKSPKFIVDEPMKFYSPDSFILEPGTEIVKDLDNTASSVTYFGVPTALSYVVPANTYMKSTYSIVAETDDYNEFSFFTEKTIKPIIGRRLFVVFSGYKFLHNLRQLGFKTFDGIIDESYDLIEDRQTRFIQAFNQLIYLRSQPAEEILKLVQPVADHNYAVLKSMDWEKLHFERVLRIIYENIKEK